ncbi:UNVERIFIED_CONTAM: hypothetical protein RMT77_019730 [Armadillidium vulgare]
MNPIHIKYDSTLKLSVIDQRELKLDLNIDNHVVKGVINSTAHQKLTGIIWNKALDHINDTLNTHQNSLNYLPSSTISIGLSTIVFVAIGVFAVIYMYKRYKRLKSVVNTFNVTYEVPELGRNIPRRQRDIPRSVRRFTRASNRIKSVLNMNKNVEKKEDDDYLSMKDIEMKETNESIPTPHVRNIDLKERIDEAIARSPTLNSPHMFRKLPGTPEPER